MYITEILSYNQDGLFYAMINSIKELDSTVTELKKQLHSIAGERNEESQHQTRETISYLELTNTSQTLLYQNEPNPFNGKTVIRYFVPENMTGSVAVIFHDMYGKEIKSIEIKERGFGRIEVVTEALVDGIYSYSILISGRVLDTKKMIKSK